MEKLLKYISERVQLEEKEIESLKQVTVPLQVASKTVLVEEGKPENYLYFLVSGVVGGYTIQNGKKYVEHLISECNFFTSMNGFIEGTSSLEYFETLTDCELYKISKKDFEALRVLGGQWNALIVGVMNENLKCKMERVNDFQRLTAKERYLKFIETTPELLLQVSIENIASFLGIEPQSLSRIRRAIIN